MVAGVGVARGCVLRSFKVGCGVDLTWPRRSQMSVLKYLVRTAEQNIGPHQDHPPAPTGNLITPVIPAHRTVPPDHLSRALTGGDPLTALPVN